jgi:hypothetical protein
MLVGGTTLLGLGTITFLAGVGLASAKPFTGYDEFGDEHKVGYKTKVWAPPLAVGFVALSVAVPLVIVGAVRHGRYKAHQRRVSMGAGPTAHGFGASMSMRF